MGRPKIKRRERDMIIQALRAGVVPKLGLQHIQVGRAREITEMVRDIERIAEGRRRDPLRDWRIWIGQDVLP